MKNILLEKKKFLAIAAVLIILISGCSSPRGKDGKTYVDSIITVEDVEVKRNEIDVPDNKKMQKKYAKYKGDDVIKIKKTTFSDAMEESWFNGIIVWPIAQLINLISGVSDAGIGIIVTTFLIQLIIFLFSIKSQVATQKMQTIQPEIAKVQAKYAGKTDDRSKMMQMQETQAIYSKYNINPIGTIVTTFIQFPVIFGMYYATMRAFAVVSGTFNGINLAITPMQGWNDKSFWHIFIFVLMVIFQLLSFKVPTWLQKYRKKKSNLKEKKYAEPAKKGNGMANSMGMMMYASTAMITVLAVNWPLAMSFYWLVNSVFRVAQNIIVHRFFIKD